MKKVEKLSIDKTVLEPYLMGQGWMQRSEKILAVEIPGAGNMNFTLRVKTNERSFIIKQSRSYVEKYPQVPAPAARALREAEFYSLISTKEVLRKQMPQLMGVDVDNHVLHLEDLGNGMDYSFLYEEGKNLEEAELRKIITFAATLHSSVNSSTTEQRLPNKEMRKLNHEHIFIYPYIKENGLDLDEILPGLKAVGDKFKEDKILYGKVQKLGNLYLSDGNTLLHGDYFPGSWLKTNDDIKIIDPEFSFFGDPEFEIGVTLAHLKMADQPQTLIDNAVKKYTDLAPLDEELCRQFMAVEMLRRILGLAQLPLSINLQHRKALLTEAGEILV